MLATLSEKMGCSADSLLTLVFGAGTQTVHVVRAWQAEKPTARPVNLCELPAISSPFL
jgi:hypothetical protein